MAWSVSFASYVEVLGDQVVGKKALLRQYLGHVPPTDQLTKVHFIRKIENIGGNLCCIEVDDLSNPFVFQYRADDVHGSLIVFDLTNRETFTNINAWLDEITEHVKAGFAKVLVGNKCDLTNQRQVSRDEAEQLAASHGMKYFETTATDHESTCDPFRCVLGQIFEARGGMTGLHRAASAGDVQAMHQLVADSPDQIDVRDDYGCSGYHYAAKNGHVNVIEGLTERGSLLIDAPDKNGWTPMHTAVYFQQGGAMEALVRLGSKVIDAPDNDGRTPMHIAAYPKADSSVIDAIGVIETLIRLGCKAIDTPDNMGLTPLHLVAGDDRVEVIEALVRLGSRALDTPDKNGATPLHHAAELGDVQAIETLIRLGSTALDAPNKRGRSPLFAAAKRDQLTVIELLVRLGSQALDTPDNDGVTPMHAIASCPWAEGDAVATLVRLGSKSIDALDREGKTPLHHAADYFSSNVAAMEALVLWGSRAIDMPDNSGSTPMKLAISSFDSVEALIRLGSCVLDRPETLFVDDEFVGDEIQVMLAIIGIPQHLYRFNQQDDLTWSEDEAAEVRYRVYFSRSLVNRLLCSTDCA